MSGSAVAPVACSSALVVAPVTHERALVVESKAPVGASLFFRSPRG